MLQAGKKSFNMERTLSTPGGGQEVSASFLNCSFTIYLLQVYEVLHDDSLQHFCCSQTQTLILTFYSPASFQTDYEGAAIRTTQVLDEVLELHLPLRLHVGAVHVCVEEDDGKGQDKDGVWILELPDQHRVTNAVSLTAEREKGEHHKLHRRLSSLIFDQTLRDAV